MAFAQSLKPVMPSYISLRNTLRSCRRIHLLNKFHECRSRVHLQCNVPPRSRFRQMKMHSFGGKLFRCPQPTHTKLIHVRKLLVQANYEKNYNPHSTSRRESRIVRSESELAQKHHHHALARVPSTRETSIVPERRVERLALAHVLCSIVLKLESRM